MAGGTKPRGLRVKRERVQRTLPVQNETAVALADLEPVEASPPERHLSKPPGYWKAWFASKEPCPAIPTSHQVLCPRCGTTQRALRWSKKTLQVWTCISDDCLSDLTMGWKPTNGMQCRYCHKCFGNDHGSLKIRKDKTTGE